MKQTATSAKTVGTESIKRLLAEIFKNARLDKNQNGKIDSSEWIQAAFSLLPSFLDPSLLNEVRDLDLGEVQELSKWVDTHFPSLAEFKPEIEAVISAVFGLIDQALRLLEAIQALNTNQPPADDQEAEANDASKMFKE